MAANFQFITSQRSGDVLDVDEYIYRKDRLVNTKRYWKCKTAGCKATALTEGQELIRASSIDTHQHVDGALEMTRQEFKDEVKQTVDKTVAN